MDRCPWFIICAMDKCVTAGERTAVYQFWANKKLPDFSESLKLYQSPILRLVFNFYDFSLVVRTAGLAYSVWHHELAAFAAFHQIWSTHLPVCSSFISS